MMRFRKNTQAFDLACVFRVAYTLALCLGGCAVRSRTNGLWASLGAACAALGLAVSALMVSNAQAATPAPTAKASKSAPGNKGASAIPRTKVDAARTTKPSTRAAAVPGAALAKGAASPQRAKAQAPAERSSGKAGVSRAAKLRQTPLSRQAFKRGGRKVVVRAAPPPPSFGQLYGLRDTADELDLKSSVALVVDQDTNEVLFSKNAQAVLPIASITKLMTALVVAEAKLGLDEMLTVTQDDVNATAASRARSRLSLGTQLTRSEMLHLALMSSENRAAHLLGRTYPGGLPRFVEAMNAKARLLGMSDTRYVEPTGLSSDNQSSAEDLARLVSAASAYPLIREMSTSLEAVVPVRDRSIQFRNTNGLVANPEWDIGLQKTGYISAAGRCVVMQAQLAGRKLIMVLLDSAGKYSRIGDAERLRHWLDQLPLLPTAAASALTGKVPAAGPAPVTPAAVQVAPPATFAAPPLPVPAGSAAPLAAFQAPVAVPLPR